MSDLQIWLVLLGVLLILIVVLVNWWQDRRVRRRMQTHFPESGHDALMGTAPGGRREPGIGFVNVAASADAGSPEEVDPATEAVIDIHFAQPVSGHALTAPLAAMPDGIGKPLRIFAQTQSGEHQQRLRPDETYSALQLAILLSNRQGALTDIEWSHLWAWAQGLAEHFDGSVEGPEQDDVLRQAQALDQVCSELDAQVMLFLRPKAGLPYESGLAVVREAGFLPYGDELAWMAESGIPRFTVQIRAEAGQSGTPGPVSQIILLLDLPQTMADGQAFSRMASVGRDLATRLDADLLDDQGRVLSDQAHDSLDQQLHELYQKLEEAGYPAGAERTVRLFS